MAEDTGVTRKTISIDLEVFEAGIKRMGSLKPRYKNFSQYVEALIQRDTQEGGSITVVREETTKVLQAPAGALKKQVKYSHRKKKARRDRRSGSASVL